MRIYTRNLPEEFSEDDLEAIGEQTVKLRDALRSLYGDLTIPSINTPKFHKLSHLTDDIRRLGHPKNYNSDRYETTHCLLKKLYRCVVSTEQSGCGVNTLAASSPKCYASSRRTVQAQHACRSLQ
jgi:hypothetical protein